jgi:uncharacterized membrane protein YebE (DUF533 family)
MKRIILTFGIVLTISSLGFGQINKRQQKQDNRVDQGIKSGQITKKENAKIEMKQAKIQHMENQARADGKVTKKEKAAITKEQNEASRQINSKKTNKRDRN